MTVHSKSVLEVQPTSVHSEPQTPKVNPFQQAKPFRRQFSASEGSKVCIDFLNSDINVRSKCGNYDLI